MNGDLRIAGATVALCLVIFVAAPSEATFFGRTGLFLGFVTIGVAAAFLAAGSRARRPSTDQGAGIDRALLLSVACGVALLGGSIIVGNLRIARVQIVVDHKNAQSERSKIQTTRYEVWSAGDPIAHRVSRSVYEVASPGEVLSCTGVRSPMLGLVLTDCLARDRNGS